ncbi:uncharacterized protein LOC122982004 isoform X2 [Thunnus albacares]|uniref:uncharacterized protein LOC122982004 isoform X2 n=1 Tax=Thunnus albacares TaxID=8236 RepID=UPI001CF6646C|nr:uncharacterized protein LOC122982004 isoform X2 [Thunnus albacares]
MYDVRDRIGRYIMEYKETPEGRRLDVTITQLTKSDSGRYVCGLDKPFWFDKYREFKINVTDAPPTSKPNLTLRPSLTSIQSASTPTTTQSLRRSSTETPNQSEEQQTETPAGGSDVLLYVGLTLVVILLLFSVAVLMYCKKRASKPKEPLVETEYADANRVYEETREDGRQSRSPPVEISSIYSAKFTKPSGVETSDDYSFTAATASRPLNKTEDNSSELVYTQVDLSSGAASSHSSAPRGHADNVIYSAPRIHTEAQTDAKDVSESLYSNVNFSQQ